MKYKLKITFGGLYLVVPDEDLKVVHLLFPAMKARGESHDHGAEAVPPGKTKSAPPAATSHSHHHTVSDEPHDAILVFEEARGLSPMILNGFDLNLSALSRTTDMPYIPGEVFDLRDSNGSVKLPLELARAETPVPWLNCRVTLRGGVFDVVNTGDFIVDGKKVALAGTLTWTCELPGRGFPGAPILSMARADHRMLPPLLPIEGSIESHTVGMGIVHCPEQFRVESVEDIITPNVKFDADHMHMLYDMCPEVTGAVIPQPAPGGSGQPVALWPSRCASARIA